MAFKGKNFIFLNSHINKKTFKNFNFFHFKQYILSGISPSLRNLRKPRAVWHWKV